MTKFSEQFPAVAAVFARHTVDEAREYGFSAGWEGRQHACPYSLHTEQRSAWLHAFDRGRHIEAESRRYARLAYLQSFRVDEPTDGGRGA